MCLVKTPKLKTDPNAGVPKDPTVIRNVYLDGVGPEANARRSGRSSLRINRGPQGIRPTAPRTATPMPSAAPPMAVAPGSPPVLGRGGYITRGVDLNVR